MKRRSRIGISLLALSMICTQTPSLNVYAKNNVEPVQQYKLSSLEQAKKNLADFEAKYAKELALINKGSQGYFESIGCSDDVLGVFTVDDSYQGEVAGYTNMGKSGDATSLENMKASIPYLREFNGIRKKEGLPELSVSMLMMAIAQVNANYAQVEGNHSSAYGTGENLA